MQTNLLKLNDSKTEFIMVGTRQNLEKAGTDTSVRVGEDQIQDVKAVQDLGYYLNCELKSTVHVNKLASSLYVTLCKISQIRHHVDTKATKMMVQALVLSMLDYCNSLLLGSSDQNLRKLQRIQNITCRVIYTLKKYDQLTPHFINLHWLKIQERIIYKTATLVYKCIYDLAPSYLSDLIDIQHGRQFRFANQMKLPVARPRTSIVAKSSFSVRGPTIWNELPLDVKNCDTLDTFKRKLKTHLFTKCYEV